MNRIYDSVLTNAYDNIAFEKQLANQLTDDVTLFLWQNDNCVVIGRNQNALTECNVAYMKEQNIVLSRRYSGGGAVFHDLGNVNYTIVIKKEKYDLEKAKQFVYDAMNDLGFNVEYTGRNDLTIDGCKFSGQAYYSHQGMYVFHGTLMFNLDISMLGKCLTPSKKKLESKGIKSVKSRVANLITIDPNITVEAIKGALVRSFIKLYGESSETYCVRDEDINQDIRSFLESDEWLLGKTPKFNIELEKRLPFGNVTLQLDVKRHKIDSVKVFTDSLQTDVSKLETVLLGLDYNEDIIWDLIESTI